MVKILPNGDIVPDDDPRAAAQSGQNRGSQRTENQRPRQGFVQHDDDQAQQGMYQGGQTVSIFQVFNQKLLDLGIPRFNVGTYAIEPIVTVGFVAAGLLMGMKGLLLAAVLFAVCQWSSQGGAPNMPNFGQWFGGGGRQGNNRGNRPRGGSSGRRPGSPGQRLGRS